MVTTSDKLISNGKAIKIDVNDIMKALNDGQYKARTLTVIARDINASVDAVKEALEKNPVLIEAVKIYPRRNSKGEVLITTRKRFYKEASVLDKFIDVFASSKPSL